MELKYRAPDKRLTTKRSQVCSTRNNVLVGEVSFQVGVAAATLERRCGDVMSKAAHEPARTATASCDVVPSAAIKAFRDAEYRLKSECLLGHESKRVSDTQAFVKPKNARTRLAWIQLEWRRTREPKRGLHHNERALIVAAALLVE